MRLRSFSILGAVTAALILTPPHAGANPILDASSAMAGDQEPDGGSVLLADIAAPESIAPLFSPPDNVIQLDLPSIDSNTDSNTGSNDQDFLTPEFLSLERGSFPVQLYRALGIFNDVPEPSLAPVMTGSLLAIAWGYRHRRRRNAKR